jgi:signal transduction histidine kinase
MPPGGPVAALVAWLGLMPGRVAAAGTAPVQALENASAWPWAFAGLAVASLLAVGWLAWRLGQAQAGARAAATAATSRFAATEVPEGAAHPNSADRPPPCPDTAAAQAGVIQTLDLLNTPALLLAEASARPPRLLHVNAAARALWPQAEAGRAVSELDAPAAGSDPAAGVLARWLAGLPVAPGAGTPAAPAGWRLARLATAAQGPAAWVLLQAAPTGTAAVDDESEQFSFTLSHDLRAPIRVVEGFTRIVKEDYGGLLDRVGNDHLDRVLGAAARMNHMIDALLTLARLSRQPLSRQPVNLSQLAGWVADELRRTAPEREVRFEIAPGLQATGDPTLLRLVLENLLGNAWKYSARNELSVIRFDTVAHGDGLAYRVQDNGAGFDMRGAERLFGLFQRLHSASEFPGTGVGLASVRRIVQRHGGEIWASAEPGRGASFCFTLAG